ncbi:unnamed protein product [Brassicogethes aeneus]|uniref:Chitin-binding type-2 domain-containing protein n=1 Tax=Brassicogethes aeneus TaxID=1431903 RepID=A0A9P0FM47_BRAAE|nr:unnamed protein product [Brassicogethes aeneus]
MKFYQLVLFFPLAFVLQLTSALFESNPFLNPQNVNQQNNPLKTDKTKQNLNQWNLAVIINQDAQFPLQGNPPGPAAPGYVWLQVPISPSNPPYVPPVTPTKPPREPSDDKLSYQTTEGWVTIEPPEILYGSDLNAKCLKPNGQFPSRTCDKFVNCWAGVATEQSCLDGLVFNPKGYCDYAQNVDCNGKPTEGPPVSGTPIDSTESTPNFGSTPSQTPAYGSSVSPTVSATVSSDPKLNKKCLKPRGQFPGITCNKFVNCWDGIATEQECPEGLLFSTKGYCDYSANVDCSNRTPPSEEKIITKKVNKQNTIETSIIENDCPLDFGTFRKKNNCSSYHTCIGGKVVARYDCPEGFSFNDNIGVCDYSYRVDCTKDPIINRKTNIPHHTNLNGPSKCPQEFGTFRDRNNCGLYFTCLVGKVVATYECPAGLSFNDVSLSIKYIVKNVI